MPDDRRPRVTTAPTLWLLVASFGASALGGMLGMASGIFIVPILTLFLGIELHTAIGASLVSVIACSCGSAAPFLRGRLTNVRLAIVLEVATTSGAASGVLASGVVSAPVLDAIFAAVLLLSALQMSGRRKEAIIGADTPPPPGWARRLDGRYPEPALAREVDYRVGRIGLGLVLMFGAGLLSALLGIGSGVLKIPAMDGALRLPIKVSTATSNFMIGVTAAAGGLAYLLRGTIVPAIAGPVALASVVGSIVGARLLMRLSSARLRLLFIVILVGLGAQMACAALGLRLAFP